MRPKVSPPWQSPFSTLNTAQTRTVYGRIPAGQDKNAGSYSSTLTITVYY